eukprot:11540762-Ditylum_brightwellii.AAC.1
MRLMDTMTNAVCSRMINLDIIGVINKINAQHEYLYDFLFVILDTGLDVIKKTADVLNELGRHVSLLHANRHQDKDTLYDELELSAKFSVDLIFWQYPFKFKIKRKIQQRYNFHTTMHKLICHQS